MQLLVEHLNPNTAKLVESTVNGKDIFLSGIFMQSECKNHNGRNYPLNEIKKAVDFFNGKITEGNYVMGELNHPDNLTIDLKNVSHIITEMYMDGNDAIGKAKILNTPAGNIVKGLLEGGVRLGVSTRGTGNVTNEGVVDSFDVVTVDIVAQPSAPNAYPSMVRECIEEKKIMTLAEAVIHDPSAQKFFEKEMKAFIDTLFSKR